jgi:iron-sulfur cluster assembly accessory protein
MTIDVQAETIELTPAAVSKVKDLRQEQNKPEHGLRVFVAGRTCSGFQYGMAFEDNPSEQDKVFEYDGVRLIIDPTSMMYMAGSQIDFNENIRGGSFHINNPNIQTNCGGCAQSSSCG